MSNEQPPDERERQDRPLRELADVFHELGRLLTVLAERRFERGQLSPTDAEVLRVIAQSPGIDVSTVARRVNMATSNTSSSISRLVALGQVVKRPAERDRRIVEVRPSAEATGNIAEFLGIEATVLAEALATLPEADRDRLTDAADALGRLRAALRSFLTTPEHQRSSTHGT
ncbi:MAG: MarR family transcriptional regulator [Actinomycetota bacterium]|nr:MarR family transcriptional regulator [Actinomycetota bacterium]